MALLYMHDLGLTLKARLDFGCACLSDTLVRANSGLVLTRILELLKQNFDRLLPPLVDDASCGYELATFQKA
jgi:hypothetical protein